MRVLALETSTGRGSLALLDDTAIIWQSQFSEGRRTAQTFSVAIADALREAKWDPDSVQLVATTNGPGSFTGLRISVTAAKFYAYATRAQLVALNTLDVIAAQVPADVSAVCVVMDAQRQQLFAGTFARAEAGVWQAAQMCQVIDRDQLATWLQPPMVLTGPALARLADTLCPQTRRTDPACWSPRAATVGQLGWHAHQAGRLTDIWQLQPCYYRPSYAEE